MNGPRVKNKRIKDCATSWSPWVEQHNGNRYRSRDSRDVSSSGDEQHHLAFEAPSLPDKLTAYTDHKTLLFLPFNQHKQKKVVWYFVFFST